MASSPPFDDAVRVKQEPREQCFEMKTSDEILNDLFSTFNAQPPQIDEATLIDDQPKSKKRKKHKRKRRYEYDEDESLSEHEVTDRRRRKRKSKKTADNEPRATAGPSSTIKREFRNESLADSLSSDVDDILSDLEHERNEKREEETNDFYRSWRERRHSRENESYRLYKTDRVTKQRDRFYSKTTWSKEEYVYESSSRHTDKKRTFTSVVDDDKLSDLESLSDLDLFENVDEDITTKTHDDDDPIGNIHDVQLDDDLFERTQVIKKPAIVMKIPNSRTLAVKTSSAIAMDKKQLNYPSQKNRKRVESRWEPVANATKSPIVDNLNAKVKPIKKINFVAANQSEPKLPPPPPPPPIASVVSTIATTAMQPNPSYMAGCILPDVTVPPPNMAANFAMYNHPPIVANQLAPYEQNYPQVSEMNNFGQRAERGEDLDSMVAERLTAMRRSLDQPSANVAVVPPSNYLMTPSTTGDQFPTQSLLPPLTNVAAQTTSNNKSIFNKLLHTFPNLRKNAQRQLIADSYRSHFRQVDQLKTVQNQDKIIQQPNAIETNAATNLPHEPDDDSDSEPDWEAILLERDKKINATSQSGGNANDDNLPIANDNIQPNITNELPQQFNTRPPQFEQFHGANTNHQSSMRFNSNRRGANRRGFNRGAMRRGGAVANQNNCAAVVPAVAPNAAIPSLFATNFVHPRDKFPSERGNFNQFNNFQTNNIMANVNNNAMQCSRPPPPFEANIWTTQTPTMHGANAPAFQTWRGRGGRGGAAPHPRAQQRARGSFRARGRRGFR